MNSAVAELSRPETAEPTAGMMAIAHGYALELMEHCYRASKQAEGSDARKANLRGAILDLEEVAKRLGYEIVPARKRHG